MPVIVPVFRWAGEDVAAGLRVVCVCCRDAPDERVVLWYISSTPTKASGRPDPIKPPRSAWFSNAGVSIVDEVSVCANDAAGKAKSTNRTATFIADIIVADTIGNFLTERRITERIGISLVSFIAVSFIAVSFIAAHILYRSIVFITWYRHPAFADINELCRIGLVPIVGHCMIICNGSFVRCKISGTISGTIIILFPWQDAGVLFIGHRKPRHSSENVNENVNRDEKTEHYFYGFLPARNDE